MKSKVHIILWGHFIAGCSNMKKEENSCQNIVIEAYNQCTDQVFSAYRDCYEQEDGLCTDRTQTSNIVEELAQSVSEVCVDEDWGNLSKEGLIGRLQNSCTSEASSLAWRIFGGPQGAVVSESSSEQKECLFSAYDAGVDLIQRRRSETSACIIDQDCDPSNISETTFIDTASQSISSQCDPFEELIAIDKDALLDKANMQVDCMLATIHPDLEGLDCGPSQSEFDVVREEWTQIVVDGDKWNTLCGDGSDYAFYIKWAPEGEPLENLLIGLQGGGVCVFEGDCSSKMENNPELFNAMDDTPFDIAISSADPEISPFANWTKVYLPYCTQDVFAGGGEIEDLGSLSLPRYGAVNARAALQMIRNTLWKQKDEEGGMGYRPDDMNVFLGGWSAGAYGTLYNYHYLLDELQWPKTTAFPDAGLALDNGELLSVRGLGDIKIPIWGTKPHLPSYCFRGECAVGPILYNALAPRLKMVPEQQMLIVTNPKDYTQQGDAYFSDEVHWINTLRQSYCDTKDLNGIHYYLTSNSEESIHVVSIREEYWMGEVAGISMRDWFSGALYEPDLVEDKAEEANFVTDIPGVNPFPCEVAP
ncbi:MAG: hypothetical protein CL916_04225 [Deltaproteobacteria bacterium]|nr:hypothetical protein [Deltaproteobacteria bacterium]